jgi:threonine/homoserine/homoserine lactone efflux protein
MISLLTAGTVLGLSAGFSPGPLLTLVITQTLRHNIKEGTKVALAPLITDLPIIIVSLLLLTQFADLKGVLGGISLLGGLYVLYLACESIFAGPVNVAISESDPQSIKKGALVNALNPHPYLFWVTVGAPLFVKAKANGPMAPLAFMGAFYAFLVGSKIVLALAVGKSRTFLTSKGYLYVMRILGGVLAAFAALLLKDAWTLLKPLFLTASFF